MENLNLGINPEALPDEFYLDPEFLEKTEKDRHFEILKAEAALLGEFGEGQLRNYVERKKELAKRGDKSEGYAGLEIKDVDLGQVDAVGLALFDRLRILEIIKKWELTRDNRKEFYEKYGQQIDGLVESYFRYLQEKEGKKIISENMTNYIGWLRNYALNAFAEDTVRKEKKV